MVTLVFLLMALIVLTLSALRWGVSSSDEVVSQEWERRQRLFWLSLKLSHV